MATSIYLKLDHIFQQVNYYLFQYWKDEQDPRTKNYPMVDINFIFPILVMYYFYRLVKHRIPEHMKNREPYGLRNYILVYNACMSLFNLVCFYVCITRYSANIYLDFAYPTDKSDTSHAREEMAIAYTYCVSKFFDLLDTIFFALKKKNSHISFLHLYHHISVPLLGWLAMKLNPMLPIMRLFATMNSFIHFVMYSYYFLSVWGPEVRKYLWWKRYITQIQLAQFVILGLYTIPLMLFQTGYPIFWLMVGLPQPFFFFYMFYDFYLRSYKIKMEFNTDINNNVIVSKGKMD